MTLTDTRRVRGVPMDYVLELQADQRRHAAIIAAIPEALQCQDHVRGQWPDLCVPCRHEREWTRINNQLITILEGAS